jgi:hypothetical protein
MADEQKSVLFWHEPSGHRTKLNGHVMGAGQAARLIAHAPDSHNVEPGGQLI